MTDRDRPIIVLKRQAHTRDLATCPHPDCVGRREAHRVRPIIVLNSRH